MVWVRAHMDPSDYSGQALRDSVSAGVAAQTPVAEFAADVALLEPLPDGCDR